MDHLNKVLCRHSYPDWFPKKLNHRPHMNQATNQETTKESFVMVPYIQGISEEFRRTLKDTKVQIIFKGCNTLKPLLMYPKETKVQHSCTKIWFTSGLVIMKTAILLTLENQTDTWKAVSRNTVPHLPVQYSNIAQS